MWTAHTETLSEQTARTSLSSGGGVMSFEEVIALWSSDAEFRNWFTSLLCASSCDAFFWETPPVTAATADRPFEFVLVNGPSLTRLHPDPSPFRSHFTAKPAEPVFHFPNLSGDATLIVPSPLADKSCYTHLARFLRMAPRAQVNAFWRTVGLAMQERLSARPVWLSTAGMGVSWLHLRLDSRPKYYRHKPYTSST